MDGRWRIATRALVGLTVLAGTVYILSLGSGSTFAYDEWVFVADRHSFSWQAVFSHHNSHPSVFPALIYLSVFRLIGLDHPEIFRTIVFAAHALIALSTMLLVRRRHGETIAMMAGALVLLSGSGAANILWGFQIGFCLSVGMYLVSYLCLQRSEERPGALNGIASSSALVVAALSSGVGVAAIAAICVAVALSPTRRSRWWVPVPAMSGFLLWYVTFGDETSTMSLGHLPSWIWNSALAGGAGFVGASRGWGAAVILPLLACATVAALRRTLPPQFVVHAVFVLAFWSVTGMGRSLLGYPDASRYLHVVASPLVLMACSLLAQNLGQSRRFILAAGLLVTGSIALQAPYFSARAHEQRTVMYGGPSMRGVLAMTELLEDRIDEDAALVLFFEFPLVTVGEYLRAVRDVGDSPAFPWRDIERAPEEIRTGADSALNRYNAVHASTAGDRGCRAASATSLVVLRGGESAVVRSDRDVSFIVRRFRTDDWSVVNWRSLGRGTFELEIPRDSLNVPWQVHFKQPLDVLACPDA